MKYYLYYLVFIGIPLCAFIIWKYMPIFNAADEITRPAPTSVESK